MRSATAEEIATHQTLTFEELPYLVPEWVLTTSRFPPDAELLRSASRMDARERSIRGINRQTHEVLIDCGFGRVDWVGKMILHHYAAHRSRAITGRTSTHKVRMSDEVAPPRETEGDVATRLHRHLRIGWGSAHPRGELTLLAGARWRQVDHRL